MYQPERKFMEAAILEAKAGKESGHYAIGAVIVKDGKIVGSSPHRTKIDNDPTQHAEVAAIRNACKKIGHRHLQGCVIYTTHEPCPMCATAAVWARVDAVVIGARIEDMAAYRSQTRDGGLSWKTLPINARVIFAMSEYPIETFADFMRDECRDLFHN